TRVLIVIVLLLVLAVVGSMLVFDPPPLQLREPNEFVLSVTPPAADGSRHPVEDGLACNHKLEGHLSSVMGRPQITLFDWLRACQAVHGSEIITFTDVNRMIPGRSKWTAPRTVFAIRRPEMSWWA